MPVRGFSLWPPRLTGGDVVGPASATANAVALFDGTTGKLLKDGGAAGSGDVVGPASATDGHLAVFDGTTGKLLKGGGVPGSGSGAWTNLGQVVTTASATDVTFSAIPGTHNALKVLWMAQDTTGGGSTALLGLRLRINGDSTAGNYTSGARVTSSNGSALMSDVAADTNGLFVGWVPPAIDTGVPFTGEVTLTGYAQTTFHKNVIGLTGGYMTSGPPTRADGQFAGRWKSTVAVTTLRFTTGLAFVDGSTFTLYGIT